MKFQSARRVAAVRLAIIAVAFSVIGCASVPNDLHDLVTRNRLSAPSGGYAGHVPPFDIVARDRDEMLGLLDSIHTHYAKAASRATNFSRFFTITEIVGGTVGATSSAFTTNDNDRARTSEIASGVALLMVAINAKLGLGDRSTSLRNCTSTLYHGVSDIRIRYSNATLPQTDSAWTRYIAFKDSIDHAVRASCD